MEVISADLKQFLELPNSMVVSSRNSALMPSCCRVFGLHVVGPRKLTFWVPTGQATALLADLAQGGPLALVAYQFATHRTLQLKGRCASTGPAPDSDQPRVQSYLAAFAEQLAYGGIPRRLVERPLKWPMTVIEMNVEGLFNQTPGPGAGGPHRPGEVA